MGVTNDSTNIVILMVCCRCMVGYIFIITACLTWSTIIVILVDYNLQQQHNLIYNEYILDKINGDNMTDAELFIEYDLHCRH